MTGAVAEATHTARYPLVRWLKGAECLLTQVARRRVLSCLVVALVALGLRIALLRVLPIPTPVFQDEYSYLLGGETLAKGRLANPTHPMWRFFETMHVNMQPAYASKYPPGQAVFLALGIRLFGHPWFGVWLSMGLLCGCICWMLQGWIPPKYALIGGLLAVLQLGVSTYWVNSYWGGAVGACGGALVLGALPRLAHRPTTKSAVAAVLGVSILANTRPFEGGVTVLFSLLALLWWAHKLQRLRRLLDRRVVMPFMVGLLLTAGAIAYYNWRVTGHTLKLPYVLNQQQYGWSSAFWLASPSTPPSRFRDTAMEHLWQWDRWQTVRSRYRPLRIVRMMCESIYNTFLSGVGWLFALLALASLLLLSVLQVRLAFCLLGGFLCVLLSERYILAHYLGPVSSLFFLIPLFGLRLFRILKVRGQQIGLVLVAILLVISVAASISASAEKIIKQEPLPYGIAFRVKVIEKLNAEPGLHLVMVRYTDHHDPHQEMVYNGADIDAQKIVWALDRGSTENQRLFAYYPTRMVWLAQPDGPTQSITPYVHQ